MDIDLSGRVAAVTGSSSGIGRGIALQLARQGAAVVCVDLRPEPDARGYETDGGEPTHEAIVTAGALAVFARADVSRYAELERAIGDGVAAFGRLDVMVNNAGIAVWGPLHEEREADYDRLMAINVKGVWGGCKLAVLRFLEQGGGGRIVNISSVGGFLGLPAEPAYCASKGAVLNLTRQVALDYAPHRIACNAICPGAIETSLMRQVVEDAAHNAALLAITPWGRLGTPADIAAAVGFLASDAAEWITGAVLPVDGGYSAH
jgi:NAD(P)-dependent dehydrogenase (short-subunit alcohol dehydrogenase family)